MPKQILKKKPSVSIPNNPIQNNNNIINHQQNAFNQGTFNQNNATPVASKLPNKPDNNFNNITPSHLNLAVNYIKFNEYSDKKDNNAPVTIKIPTQNSPYFTNNPQNNTLKK